ncbi:MAG: prenyltransferase [Pseudomonadales bacterium]|jgi:1,4-dihydroxy-2-naphthoate octaprenyltransferase|nr:prenyltransferase [Pseudomonadales bacterium]
MARPLLLASVLAVHGNGLLIARAQGHALVWIDVLWSTLALLLVSASIHYANEYADVETDACTRRTRYSGGSGVLPAGLVPRRFALRAAGWTLALGLAVGLAGAVAGAVAPVVLAALVLGAILGWQYSLAPLRLAWRGWGELDNAVLGGLLLHVFGHATASRVFEPALLLLCLPFTLLVFVNLLATGWADREADAAVGKRTLATRLSPVALRRLHGALGLSAYLLLLGTAGWLVPLPVVAAGLLSAPVLAYGWWCFTRVHAPYATSNAMVVMLLAQLGAWYAIGS